MRAAVAAAFGSHSAGSAAVAFGAAALWCAESSGARAQTCVPCVGGQTPKPRTTGEGPTLLLISHGGEVLAVPLFPLWPQQQDLAEGQRPPESILLMGRAWAPTGLDFPSSLGKQFQSPTTSLREQCCAICLPTCSAKQPQHREHKLKKTSELGGCRPSPFGLCGFQRCSGEEGQVFAEKSEGGSHRRERRASASQQGGGCAWARGCPECLETREPASEVTKGPGGKW